MRGYKQSIPRVQIRLQIDKALKEAYREKSICNVEKNEILRRAEVRHQRPNLRHSISGLKRWQDKVIQPDHCYQRSQNQKLSNEIVMQYVQQIYETYPIKDYSRKTQNRKSQKFDSKGIGILNQIQSDQKHLMLSTMRTLPSKTYNKQLNASVPIETFHTGRKGRQTVQIFKTNNHIYRNYKPQSSPSKSMPFNCVYSSLKSSYNNSQTKKSSSKKPNCRQFGTPKRILLKSNLKNCCSTKSQLFQNTYNSSHKLGYQLNKINQNAQNMMLESIKSAKSVTSNNKYNTKLLSSRLNSEQYNVFTQKKQYQQKTGQQNQPIFRYCLICQQPILQAIINQHQTKCLGFSQIYKKSVVELRNIILLKISQIKERIEKKLSKTRKDKYYKIKDIYDLTEKLCQDKKYINESKKWKQLKERDYIQIMKNGNTFICILDDVAKLRWFSLMIENLDKIGDEKLTDDNI